MSVTVREDPSGSQKSTGMPDRVDVEAWYRQYGESVYRRCMRLCGEHALALDLVQEVFMRAHRFGHTYRGGSSPLSWLYAIAQRCFVDALRKKPRVSQEALATLIREEELGIDSVYDRRSVVTALLARVPADVRDIVVLRYFDELEHQEIADRLGINEKTVRRKLERFLSSARKFLSRQTG